MTDPGRDPPAGGRSHPARDDNRLLADEPTGNLDSRAQEEFMAVVEDLRREGKTIIMVTHNADLARRADRTVAMQDGRLCAEPAGAAG